MKRDQAGGFLTAIFVDYDNIYLSLKRKSEEAAKRFAKDAALWLKAIETGQLITPTNGPGTEGTRRLVSNRCYGNPVPRRNTADNSTDMSSFPFVRHHFLRAGFEIIDCPPLTAQLKNSSDIRMVMDVRDYLTHATYFDEFVILSGDADFTPVLHRLRAHARRTVIFANDYTAAPYTAISDGEVREADLIRLLTEGRLGDKDATTEAIAAADAAMLETARRDIIADVTAAVRASGSPVPLEVLADRAVRAIGHDRTIGTSWGGAGSFRELIAQGLPEGMKLSTEPPYIVIDTQRHIAQPTPVALIAQQQQPQPQLQPQLATAPAAAAPQPGDAMELRSVPRSPIPPAPQGFVATREIAMPARAAMAAPAPTTAPAAALQPQQSILRQPMQLLQEAPAMPSAGVSAQPPRMREMALAAQQAQQQQPHQQQPIAAAPPAPQPPRQTAAEGGAQGNIQQSIARIHDACQAPPLAPPEYRLLFEVMAQEINENGLIGAQTIMNITQRAAERGIEIRRDDARFVLEVVSEADPWFEQGASANLFAGRFRNFVVARCRSQGLNLSADELDLIEAWFAGNAPAAPMPMRAPAQPAAQQAPPAPMPGQRPMQHAAEAPRRMDWTLDESHQIALGQRQRPAQPEPQAEDFPRIVRTRLRG